MLSLQKQPACAGRPKYIRKTIKLPNGSLGLVVFELVEVNGKTIAKAVYGELIQGETLNKDVVITLPIYFETQHITPIVSPFFSKVKILIKDLAFVISQPSRAPSF